MEKRGVNEAMALSGNGRTLYEIRGRNDTRLRLTLATDQATAKLRVDWRWWNPSRVPGRTHDTTARQFLRADPSSPGRRSNVRRVR